MNDNHRQTMALVGFLAAVMIIGFILGVIMPGQTDVNSPLPKAQFRKSDG